MIIVITITTCIINISMITIGITTISMITIITTVSFQNFKFVFAA